MPATEQTWRNPRLLHVIFGVTSLVLLISTLWMFYADSNREWKYWQKEARGIDLTMNAFRQQQASLEAQAEETRLAAALLTVRSQPVEAEQVQSFIELIQNQMGDEAASTVEDLQTLHTTQVEAAAAAAAKRQAAIEATQKYQQAHQQMVSAHSSGAESTVSQEDLETLDAEARAADEEATAAEEMSAAARDALLEKMRSIIDAAAFEEKSLLTRLKFRRADYDKARADVDIAIRDSLPAEELQARQAIVDEVKEGEGGVDRIQLEYQAASDYRKELQKVLDAILDEQLEAEKALKDNQAEQVRLAGAYVEQRSTYFTDSFPFLGKKWLEMPILDAFGSPLKIDNLWTEGLTINNNFREVRRFDRCTTCHRNMDKSKPGTPTDPAYEPQQEFELVMFTPAVPPQGTVENGEQLPPTLNDVYGFQLAESGLLDAKDVTVSLVWPETLAAKAFVLESAPGESPTPGLLMADVIAAINGSPVRTPEEVRRYLLEHVEWGEPVQLTIHRGFPNPFKTHPRLDLYLGSTSPHPMNVLGCTICHEGQGSATDFEWASHTPNSVEQRNQWVSEHQWFDNHHWIFPMYPDRFVESTCLKCHHEVVELEPSERFPDPPAPKLVEGYQLIRDYGCFGCHEISGYDGPDRRVGPDLRAEPNYFAAAQQLSADPNFEAWLAEDPERASLVHEVIHHPDVAAARHELFALIEQDENSEQPLLDQASHNLADLLRDVEIPGTLRRVGPSLRFVGSKDSPLFLYDWIAQPSHFRPDTKMPQFFGLLDHMHEEVSERSQVVAETIANTTAGGNEQIMAVAKRIFDEQDTSLATRMELSNLVLAYIEEQTAHEDLEPGAPGETPSLRTDEIERLVGLANQLVDDAERFEPVEIRGIVAYLMDRSQPFEYAELPEGIEIGSGEEQLERGKILFETRGCLACHMHDDFPEATATQGPNLSRIGDKLAMTSDGRGAEWLYSWLLNPSNYHVRTVMPNLFLEPITATVDGETVTTDPAADIAAFLMADITGWEPKESSIEHMQVDPQALDELVLENLEGSYYVQEAQNYLLTGIPESQRDTLKGAEIELVLPQGEELTEEQKLIYIGRRTIMKYGCAGCHDIPGFEDAKPIGTSLADWGTKESSRLAFEHILEYVGHGHGPAVAHGPMAHEEAHEDAATAHAEAAVGGAPREPLPDFYQMHLESGDRIGFIFQKLREPRSYDFRKNENRQFGERLRMPEFPFNNEEREAIVTFVLGLVATPPAEQFVYQPDERMEAIIAGRQVLQRYNCTGCHMLEAERWDIAYQPGQIEPLPMPNTYPFIIPHSTPEELEASLTPDHQGNLHATLTGMPRVDATGHPEILMYSEEDEAYFTLDEMGYTLEELDETAQLAYYFELWDPVAIEGQTVPVKGTLPEITQQMLLRRRPTEGGDLVHLLLPRVIELNDLEKGSEAYGWLPPPLMGEGNKVKSQWLHDFLLEPYPIRPAVVLRMPKFNMSSEEATQLAAYFAARDNAEYPYLLPEQRRQNHLASAEAQYQEDLSELGLTGTRFGDTMQIVTDAAGCVKCHYVGDFAPDGSPFALAPNLADVYDRLQPEYMRRWIAKPDWILPYTPMPENIPYDGPGFVRAVVDANGETTQVQLYHGSSTEQLDALVDLLSNYDRYAREQAQITPLVEANTQSGGDSGESAEADDAAANEPAAASRADTQETTENRGEEPPTDAAALTPVGISDR